MFKGPMDAQHKKLIDMLSFIVAFIDQPDKLLPEVVEMVKRHEGYGAKPAHYEAVGEVLLWTLEKGLGKQWNNTVADAWAACYHEIMQVVDETVEP